MSSELISFFLLVVENDWFSQVLLNTMVTFPLNVVCMVRASCNSLSINEMNIFIRRWGVVFL